MNKKQYQEYLTRLDCPDFKMGRRMGNCDGMGHYKCNKCKFRKPKPKKIMDKSQYQCIKAAHNEVEAYERDGYQVTMRCSAAGGWWMRFMKHPNGNSILIEMNAARTEMRVSVNGDLKKCQKFGA